MVRAARNLRISLRAIIYREDDCWVAHCLEMDIVSEGSGPQDALRNLDDLCGLQIKVALEEGDLESIFKPAPPEIWKMYTYGDDMPPIKKPTKPVDRFEARELEFA